MKIFHIAPFAPNRCGLYEAARDMMKADFVGGNEVYFIDTGIIKDGKNEGRKVGAVDNRAGFKIETCKPIEINNADIIIMHTGFSDNILVQSNAPLIWVIHGRPLACFRPERMKQGQSYSMYRNVSHWQRTKAMMYFWKEYIDHWKDIIPNEKHLVLDYPVIDEHRFNSTKEKYQFKNHGKYNILICDSERIDNDLYELIIGVTKAAEILKDFKFHFYGISLDDGKMHNCYNLLLKRLKDLGCLGDVSGRVRNMETLYNSADCIMSPNRIITRTIAEALSCGCPVISQNNPYTKNIVDITCDMAIPEDVVQALQLFKVNKDNNNFDKNKIQSRARVFNLENYYKKMNQIYKSLVK